MSDKKPTLAETICETTRDYLLNHQGVIFGQCLNGAGQVAGTVPALTEEQGVIELPMADVMNSGIAVGYAYGNGANRDGRAIYLVRYAGFQWFNSVFLANFASKTKEMSGRPAPILIRTSSSDGSTGPSIGPVASCSIHGLFVHNPGMKIIAPMTPDEWVSGWDAWLDHDDPLFISEYRTGYGIRDEMPDIIHDNPDITLFPISTTRLNVLKALPMLEKEGIICNVIHLVWLKPCLINQRILDPLEKSRHGGIVLDSDFENGVSKCIACDIMQHTSRKVRVMGLEERASGFAAHLDNLPPTSEKIYKYVKNIVGK